MLLLLATVAQAKVSWCWHKPRQGRTGLDYLDAAELAADEADRAATELREPTPIPAELANGLLELRVERTTLQLADPANQVVVVESGGAEVLRHEPTTATPHTPGGIYSLWWSLVLVPAPPDARPLTVHLVDRTLQSRCTWTVGADGKVALVK